MYGTEHLWQNSASHTLSMTIRDTAPCLSRLACKLRFGSDCHRRKWLAPSNSHGVNCSGCLFRSLCPSGPPKFHLGSCPFDVGAEASNIVMCKMTMPTGLNCRIGRRNWRHPAEESLSLRNIMYNCNITCQLPSCSRSVRDNNIYDSADVNDRKSRNDLSMSQVYDMSVMQLCESLLAATTTLLLMPEIKRASR